ncbi:MAG TPA: YtxH domain-containing protein, partial [Anaerolineales bacterium]|nr:YtxH domain-containing protein [Anaerolineales bacterium]
NRTFNFLLGALIGGLVGATVAILLTPASGEELRSQMKMRADHIRADVMEAAAERRAELEHQLAALRAPKKSKT